MAKLSILCLLIAAAAIGLLWVTGVVAGSELGEVAVKTFGVIAILIVVSVAWRAVRGRANAPDSSDQPVP